MSAENRSFLFLQGPCTPFFARLADYLQGLGHAIHKINFNSGDLLYWAPRPSYCFRAPLNELPDFIANITRKHGITDQVLFGDCRPVHKPAIAVAKQAGIRSHVFEEGYFRPFWITLEREGVNGRSLLPKDPDWFRSVSQRLPSGVEPNPFQSPFSVRAFHDVMYNLACLSNPVLFKHYRRHAPDPAMLEYAGYIKRFFLLNLHKNQDRENIAQLLRKHIRFFFLPLQLSSDTQIREYSRFSNMIDVMDTVMRSFAEHAPSTTWLVIKVHPLDAGLHNYRQALQQLTEHYQLTGRVLYLHSGDLTALLTVAAGTVTVNSTVGGLALSLGCPTITLADPIYNVPGLTFQGDLDTFWRNPQKPDADLFRCYSNTVIQTTQINGGFYCRQGITLAINHAGALLTREQSLLQTLL